MKKHAHHKNTRRHHIALTLASFVFITCACVLIWLSTFRIPDLNSFEQRKVSQSTKIYDNTGTILLYDIFKGSRRTVVPTDDISDNIKKAAVAIEDDTFYENMGIRPISFLRAILANITSGGYSQGGSTITQQVIKNSLLTQDKSITRKIKEWVLAIKLTQTISKDEILGVYLNESPYGGNVYGVEEASQEFFGKTAKDVSVAEAAYLAAIPQAPTTYSPYGNNKDKLDARKNLVLNKMLEIGFIDNKTHAAARAEKVEFKTQRSFGIKAPHFVMFVKDELEKEFGVDIINSGGLTIKTTLNYELQDKVEKLAKERALSNEKNFNAENLGIVILDPKTGNIQTMVGSRNYFDKEIDGNFNITTANRQPGSTMKPIVYATAFEKGFTPDTVLFDVPTEFSTECTIDGTPKNYRDIDPKTCYHPENYDGIFRGPITMRNALAQSINIPAIKTLYLAGLPNAIKTAQAMGLSSLDDPDRYGLTLVLGGGEVSLLNMTNAYAVFASDGYYKTHNAILSVKNQAGEELYVRRTNEGSVLSPNTARTIADVLSDNTARTPAYGPRSVLYFNNRDIAVKTGTTNDYRDAWTIGFSPNIAVGVWAGNNNNSPMEKKVAGQIVAPIWSDIMKIALDTVPKEYFKKPEDIPPRLKPVLRGVWEGGDVYTIDSISGKLATNLTPEETKEDRVLPNIHSILYWVNKNNPRGEKPEDPTKDSQFEHWEAGVQKWVQNNNISQANIAQPTGYDNVHVPENMPVIQITGINENDTLNGDSVYEIHIANERRFPITKTNIYLNDMYIGSAIGQNQKITLDGKKMLNAKAGVNKLTFEVTDSIFNKTEKTISFNY
jgi:1A family penicillin-binding protein